MNVIHKLDCMPLAYCGFLRSIPAVKTNVEINQQHALRQLTPATHMHLTTCTSSHLALQLGWKKKKKKKKELNIQVVSLLSRRKVAGNHPYRKCRSRGAVDTELKTVKLEKRVKEHPNKPLTISNGKHFCHGIRA